MGPDVIEPVPVLLREDEGVEQLAQPPSSAPLQAMPSPLPRIGDVDPTAKAGVIGLTKALAKEVATHGILVHAVAPAVIGTELLQQMTKETVDMLVAKIPMGRVGTPAEVAALVAWLASDECTFTTGAVHDLSGGRATY